VSPLRADLSGLPPLLIQVGTAETLLDDAVRLADRARNAGMDVRLEAWDDLVHVFQAFAPMVPEAVEAIDGIGRFVRERTGAPAST
jgi:acetyl esterase/lipase